MVNTVDMKKIFSLVVTFIAFVTSENRTQTLEAVGEALQKEILAFKQPIDETIAAVGSSQCANVKKLLGVSYEQLEGDREPDLSKLNLVYKTRAFSEVFNLSRASDLVRQARGLNTNNKVVIFVHGFTDDPTKNSFTNISDSFIQSEEGKFVTLLALDGSSLLRWFYLRASTCVRFMGDELAETLVTLVRDGVPPSQIHMVGHSLGAHVSGFTGKRFFALTGQKLGRITGLDPAGPCFTNLDTEFRLSPTDAEYVDVIHSDAGVYGIKEIVGQANYLPNGGSMQPNCLFQTCSHSRSWLIFGVSVLLGDIFPAIRCADYEAFKRGECDGEISYMGYQSKPGTKGLFFLQTNGKYPFGKGMDGIKYKNNNGIVRNLQEGIARNVQGGIAKNVQDGIVKNVQDGVVKNVQDGVVKNVKNVPVLGKLPIFG
ncbi:pancreatic triacylglycerol lipase-like [Epargyreus clarus]|uniref:pancreatic triacylglycerol lipase-like n=1 Tax=Epargyreus clarus TaxID=520877 RepID=UPI003C2E2AA4